MMGCPSSRNLQTAPVIGDTNQQISVRRRHAYLHFRGVGMADDIIQGFFVSVEEFVPFFRIQSARGQRLHHLQTAANLGSTEKFLRIRKEVIHQGLR